MASSSSHSHQNEEHHESHMPSSSSARNKRAFSEIEPRHERRKVSESARLYDVFINHRGPDVKITLALDLYDSLEKLKIRTFLDSEEKQLGESLTCAITTAIRSAAVHIAIFSKRYAESPWCLEELLLMLQTKAKIIPVFYDVEPSALRHIEKGVYGKAFAQYQEKGRHLEKLEEWKAALQFVSFITGENFNSSGDRKKIVSAVEEEVKRTKCIIVAKHPVGLPEFVEDFEKQCIEKAVKRFGCPCEINKPGEGKTMIVGIFGMGGVGKSTLSKEIFNRKRSHYNRSCFLSDIREASARSNLPSLQMKLLRDLFTEDHHIFTGVVDGVNCLRDRISRSVISNFLIVVDDIDHLEQLEALCISDMVDKFKDCLVLVTTRDEGVLINAGITARYHMKGMDKHDAKVLFCWYAFRQPEIPDRGYKELVEEFVNFCQGLPLSIQVVGSHVLGCHRGFWESELQKVKKVLPQDILKCLRISIEPLDKEEKQIFMDIACSFVGESTTKATRVWEASGWNSQHALQRLKNKCLVEEIEISDHEYYFSRSLYEISELYPKDKAAKVDWARLKQDSGEKRLKMHDHLRDLGREMADEVSNPRRLWRFEHLQCLESKGFMDIITQPKFRCLHSFTDPSIGLHFKFFLGQSNDTVEASNDLLWLEIEPKDRWKFRYFPRDYLQRDFPPWIPLQNLRCLKIRALRGLWQSDVKAPMLLKELVIWRIKDLQELSLGSLGCLEKLEIDQCADLKRVTGISDHAKLAELKIIECGNLESIRFHKLRCIRFITIHCCRCLEIWIGIKMLRMLEDLYIFYCDKLEFEDSSMCHLDSLKKVQIWYCENLKNLSRITQNTKLVELKIGQCGGIHMLSLGFLHCLEELQVHNCGYLKSVTGLSDLTKLVKLYICSCGKIEELSLVRLTRLTECFISDVPMLKRIEVNGCGNLQEVRGGFRNLVKLDIYDCPGFENMIDKENLYSLERLQLWYCSKRTLRKCLEAMKKVPSEFIKIIGGAVDGAESALNANLPWDFSNSNSVVHNGIEKTCNHLGRHVVGAIILCGVVRVNTCAAAKTVNELIKEWDVCPWLRFEVRPGEWIITFVTMREDDVQNYIVNKGCCFPFDYLCFGEDVRVKTVSMPVLKGEENKITNMVCRIVEELYQS